MPGMPLQYVVVTAAITGQAPVAGTEPVPAIVSLAVEIELSGIQEHSRACLLRDRHLQARCVYFLVKVEVHSNAQCLA